MRILFSMVILIAMISPVSVNAEDTANIVGNWCIHTTSHRGYESWETKIIQHEGKYRVITVQPFLGRSDCVLTLKGDIITMAFPFTYSAPGTPTVETSFIFTGTIERETMRGVKTTKGTNTHGDDAPVAWVALKKHESY